MRGDPLMFNSLNRLSSGDTRTDDWEWLVRQTLGPLGGRIVLSVITGLNISDMLENSTPSTKEPKTRNRKDISRNTRDKSVKDVEGCPGSWRMNRTLLLRKYIEKP